jgi:hypothetical protein
MMKFLFLLFAMLALHAVVALPDDEIMALTTNEEPGHECYENDDNTKYNTMVVLVTAAMEKRYAAECSRRRLDVEPTKNLRGAESGRELQISIGSAICRSSYFMCAFYGRGRRKLESSDDSDDDDDEDSSGVVSITMPLEDFLEDYEVHKGKLRACVKDIDATFEYRC